MGEHGRSAEPGAGDHFITAKRKYFPSVEPDPIHCVGIVEINETGDSWRIVWGLADGAKPTSEFPTISSTTASARLPPMAPTVSSITAMPPT